MLAAQVVRECEGDYRSEKLQAYYNLIEQRFGQRQPKPGLLERLPLGIKQAVASQLMKTQWFTRNIVADRWFLHSQQPALPSATNI